MFAVEIPGDVHEFDGVERAAPVPRRHGGMRGFAVEEILNRDKAAPVAFAGAVGRGEIAAHVGTEDDLDILEISGANVKRFCGDQLFGDAGKKFDRAGKMIFLHLLFEDERGGDVDGHAGIVSFAVAGCAFNEGSVVRDAGFLRSARNAVFVGDEGDDGFSAAVRRDPGGGNAGNSLFDLEAVFFENAGDVFRGFDFLEAQFAETENLIDHLLRKRLQFFGFFGRFVLEGVQRRKLLGPQKGRYNKEESERYEALAHREPSWAKWAVK